MLRVSTMVPTFSILFKQVTGELITSLDGGGAKRERDSKNDECEVKKKQ